MPQWSHQSHWCTELGQKRLLGATNHVTSLQMNHVGSKLSAEEMFSALSVTHDNKAHQTVNHIQCQLYETKVLDADDLLKHLGTLKSYRDHINRHWVQGKILLAKYYFSILMVFLNLLAYWRRRILTIFWIIDKINLEQYQASIPT